MGFLGKLGKALVGGGLGFLTGGPLGAALGAGSALLKSSGGGGGAGGGSTAEQFYQGVLRGGGFLPGQREGLQTDISRQLGAQANLQGALLNERLAAVPGASGTAFGDAARNQLVRGRQEALQNALSGLNQQGIQNQFAAAQALYGGEQAGRERKAGLLGSLGGGLLSAGGAIGGALISKSSVDYKRNIKSANPDKLLKALRSVDVKKFKYKEGLPEDDGMEHTGVLAEDAGEVMPEMLADEKHVSIPDTLGVLIAAVQSLSDKVDKLSGGVNMKKSPDGIYKRERA